MCIMAIIPKDAALPDEATLRRCWQRNSDGGGIAWNDAANHIQIVKHQNVESFIKNIQAVRKANAYATILIHMRLATHGAKNVENTHPFTIKNGSVFAHNGVISQYSSNKDKSDSRLFGEDILDNLTLEEMRNETIATLIENYIGFNKVAILNKDGSYIIYNKSKGEQDGLIWWSNTGYKDYTSSYTPPSRQSKFDYESSMKVCECCGGDVYCTYNINLTFEDVDGQFVLLKLHNVCYKCKERLTLKYDCQPVSSAPYRCKECNNNVGTRYEVVINMDNNETDVKMCARCFEKWSYEEIDIIINCHSEERLDYWLELDMYFDTNYSVIETDTTSEVNHG